MNETIKGEKLLQAQEDALALMQSARLLAAARKSAKEEDLSAALDKNMRLWTAIKTLMENKNQTLPDQIRKSLENLASFVVAKTLEKGVLIEPDTLKTLENINLQIAEGLLENVAPCAAQQNALALLDTVNALNDAQKTNDPSLTTAALDKNLRLWTALLTLSEKENGGIPKEACENLKKLGHFIIQKTLETGEKPQQNVLSLLTNLNLQIAHGFLENQTLSSTQQDAFELLQAALVLSEAKEKGDIHLLNKALDKNLKLWTAIRTWMQQDAHPLAKEIKNNLIRLADYAAQKTVEIGRNPEKSAYLDTLINLNLQISEGLLERRGAA